MTVSVSEIWRHPIKAHGREALDQVELIAGKTMPWDRTWAVAHEQANCEGGQWASCANFSRGAKAPGLQAINARLDEAARQVTLTHPDLPELTFRPDEEADRFLDWVAPIMPEDRAASARIVTASDRGMTDTDFASISLLNSATNREISEQAEQNLSMQRWRGNIHLTGLDPWEEFSWIGKKIRIGSTTLIIREPITRCMATTANPETGLRDADTLAALRTGWSHQDFGIYGEVLVSGKMSRNDEVRIVP